MFNTLLKLWATLVGEDECFLDHNYLLLSGVDTTGVLKMLHIRGVFKKSPNICYKNFIAHFTTF